MLNDLKICLEHSSKMQGKILQIFFDDLSICLLVLKVHGCIKFDKKSFLCKYEIQTSHKRWFLKIQKWLKT